MPRKALTPPRVPTSDGDSRVAVLEVVLTEREAGLGGRYLGRRLAVLGLPEGFRFRVNLAPHSTERPWRDNPIDLLVAGIDPHLAGDSFLI